MGTFGAFTPSDNFKTLHNTYDICRKLQRTKMKFHILIIKILYSDDEDFHKCSVRVRFHIVSYLSSGEESLQTHHVTNKYYIVITPVEQSL